MDTLQDIAPTEAHPSSIVRVLIDQLGEEIAKRESASGDPALGRIFDRLIDAIGESPATALELDDIQERLLTLVGHFQCADSVLFNLQDVPEELQPASIVLHRATEELDQLHNELDRWNATHVYRQKTEADREAAAAKHTQGMTPKERKRYRVSMGLPPKAPESVEAAA